MPNNTEELTLNEAVELLNTNNFLATGIDGSLTIKVSEGVFLNITTEYESDIPYESCCYLKLSKVTQ